MKKLALGLALLCITAAVAAGGYYGFRLAPLVTADNSGAEKVVLLHGLGRNERAMLLLEGALTGAGYEVHNIGYPTREGSIGQLVAELGTRIDQCCADAPAVHYVGHSLGGLMIRAYLGERPEQSVGRVVLIGSPNKGSELADAHRLDALTAQFLERAGPIARSLTTAPTGFPASLPVPHYEVGVIAGTKSNTLTNRWLPLPNDGLVTVESAKLASMKDFVVVDESHWGLRNDPAVGELVIAFLRDGAFPKDL